MSKPSSVRVLDGREYLYWYSVQAEGGIEVEDSESYIDKKHLEYWEECIDPSYGMVDLDPQVLMIPKPIYETMEELDRQYDDTFKKSCSKIKLQLFYLGLIPRVIRPKRLILVIFQAGDQTIST